MGLLVDAFTYLRSKTFACRFEVMPSVKGKLPKISLREFSNGTYDWEHATFCGAVPSAGAHSQYLRRPRLRSSQS